MPLKTLPYFHRVALRQRFADLGGVPGGETPAEYDAFIAQERKSWAQIVKAAGLSLE